MPADLNAEAPRDTTASVYFAPDIFLFDLIQARMDTIGGIHLLVRPRSDGTSPRQRVTQDVLRSSVFDRLRASTADLRVVVETTTLDIAAGQPAIDHVRAAISAGCHVVTANKGPAAFAYAPLHAEAERAGVSFLFEGAVMDGVPIFNLVRETLPAVNVLGFRGVVNATTNHILSALEDGEAFGPALARMQALGIAEADPSLDVDGWDAAAKTAALANVLMDARITPQTVERTGLTEASGAAALSAVERGKRLRLVAAARLRAGDRMVVDASLLHAHEHLRGRADDVEVTAERRTGVHDEESHAIADIDL